MNYVPFLKFKVNEVSAIKALGKSEASRVTPFFDLPRLDTLNEDDLIKLIDKAHRKYEINLQSIPYFYIDNYDISDQVTINGSENYKYLIDTFSGSDMVPVVGIDREDSRNRVVIDGKVNGIIKSDSVAIRIVSDDFLSYSLIEDELSSLTDELEENFSKLHLIMDNRVCLGVDTIARASQITKFINDISDEIDFDRIIVTGSTIPASIRDLLEPNAIKTITRSEVEIFNRVVRDLPDVIVGDYTTVSPLYSDVKVQGELMRRITAPKIIYSYDEKMYFMRGGALEGHPRGNKQYNDLSVILVAEPFFRKHQYSFGDNYLTEKSNNIGANATPSTIPKVLINAHITFMMNDFM